MSIRILFNYIMKSHFLKFKPIMKKILVLLVLISNLNICAQDLYFENPIIRGGYPDPSICRVENDYYLVNSSFEYFPGLPIHHSTDLVNWKLIGYGLHDKSQCSGKMNLMDVQSNGGIHAPTIRYHKGKFYIITTNVYQPIKEEPAKMINFVITANDPKGPWSNPIIIKGAPGIDPDIFFNDDGKIYYTGTHSPEKPNFLGEGEIWMQELDSNTFQLIGDRHFLWRGACQGTWAEGPHIYKKDEWYYLMIAEGGTGFNHAVMIAASKNITGPYQANDRNPILTTRHLSYDYWVNSTGHADMVELPNGEWKMVCLGIRNEVNRASNMGRETLILPVIWEKEPYWWKKIKYNWPVCSPESGKIEKKYPNFLALNDSKFTIKTEEYNFNENYLSNDWIHRRVPLKNSYDLTTKNGNLTMFCKEPTIKDRTAYNFIGVKQKESNFEVFTTMKFKPTKNGEEAGLCLIQKDDNYLLFDVKKVAKENVLQLIVKYKKKELHLKKELVIDKKYNNYIELKVMSKDNQYFYYYRYQSKNPWQLFDTTSGSILLSEGYTGAHIGFYATSNKAKSNNYAAFDVFNLKYH